jgi:hypothetical protein
MEVIDEELVQASPPPLPQSEDAADDPEAQSPSRVAKGILPAVRAGLKAVKALEGRLEVLEARLSVAAQSNDNDSPAPAAGEPDEA